MADANPNTTNPFAPYIREQRTFTAHTLAPFVTDLLHATHALALVDVEKLNSVDGEATYDWLASFAHARAHELNALLDGHQPLFLTDYDGGKRRDQMAALPTYSEYVERLQAPALKD